MSHTLERHAVYLMRQTFYIPGDLPGLNEIIDAAKSMGAVRRKRYSAYQAMKAKWGQYCGVYIRKARLEPFHSRVKIRCTWCAVNQRHDPDNIEAGIKFILDALTKEGVLAGDGWRGVFSLSHEFRITKEAGVEVELCD